MIVQLTHLFLCLSVSRTQSSVWLKVLHWTTLPPNCLLRVPVNQRKAQRPWLASWLHCQHPLVASRGNTAGMDPQQSSTLPPNCTDLVGESLVSRTLMCFFAAVSALAATWLDFSMLWCFLQMRQAAFRWLQFVAQGWYLLICWTSETWSVHSAWGSYQHTIQCPSTQSHTKPLHVWFKRGRISFYLNPALLSRHVVHVGLLSLAYIKCVVSYSLCAFIVFLLQIVLWASGHPLWSHLLPQMSGALPGPQPQLPSVQRESIWGTCTLCFI